MGNNRNKENAKKFDKTQILVSVITAIFAIVSSIIVTSISYDNQLEQQRIEEARETKRTYYNEFIEAYTNKLSFVDKPDSPEKVEAEMKFVLEVNRLPLYASQEMVEFINSMWDNEKATMTSTSEFYDIMRQDLCSDSFLPFDDLDAFSMAISEKVVIKDSEGKRSIQ